MAAMASKFNFECVILYYTSVLYRSMDRAGKPGSKSTKYNMAAKTHLHNFAEVLL